MRSNEIICARPLTHSRHSKKNVSKALRHWWLKPKLTFTMSHLQWDRCDLFALDKKNSQKHQVYFLELLVFLTFLKLIKLLIEILRLFQNTQQRQLPQLRFRTLKKSCISKQSSQSNHKTFASLINRYLKSSEWLGSGF